MANTVTSYLILQDMSLCTSETCIVSRWYAYYFLDSKAKVSVHIIVGSVPYLDDEYSHFMVFIARY